MCIYAGTGRVVIKDMQSWFFSELKRNESRSACLTVCRITQRLAYFFDLLGRLHLRPNPENSNNKKRMPHLGSSLSALLDILPLTKGSRIRFQAARKREQKYERYLCRRREPSHTAIVAPWKLIQSCPPRRNLQQASRRATNSKLGVTAVKNNVKAEARKLKCARMC